MIDREKLNELLEERFKLSLDKEELKNKELFNQYYTSKDVGYYMADMIDISKKASVTLLDPGSGLGILTICMVIKLLQSDKIKNIKVTVYEIDKIVIEYLKHNMIELQKICFENDVELTFNIKNEDFIYSSINAIKQEKINKFDYVIMNPPYEKMSNESEHKKLLEVININVSNYYAAFVLLATKLLKKKGQLVAITPRSFCNGSYFYDFRKSLLQEVYFNKIHLFESRKDVFKKEEVLQETIIYHCIKGNITKNTKVNVYHSSNYEFNDLSEELLGHDDLIYGDDLIIRISKNNEDKKIINEMMKLSNTLNDIGLNVSTGPVVDFRQMPDDITKNNVEMSVPLIFCEHIVNRKIEWPLENVKKFNYIVNNKRTRSKLRLNGNYILVKRMTSKEEKKRIVAAIYKDENNTEFVGFDNKLNYYHINKSGLDISIAKGLCLYLNSTFVDLYFRTISGSTQVNVSDLKNFRYPSIEQIKRLGMSYVDDLPNQKTIDKVVESIVGINL